MAYIGGGTGEVTFQVQNQQAQNQTYRLVVSEVGSSLSLLFTPMSGSANTTPIVQLAISNYQPGTQEYTSTDIGKGLAVLVTAAFDYPYGPEYVSAVGSSGEVQLSWVITSTGRTYTGFFWAYGMPGEGAPMSLKFVKFSFETASSLVR